MNPATILCRYCGEVELKEWMRVWPAVPVVVRGKIVGWVAVFRHRACRDIAAVPVRVVG